MASHGDSVTLIDRVSYGIILSVGFVLAALAMLNEARKALQSALCGRRIPSLLVNGEPALPSSYSDPHWGVHGRILANGVLHHFVSNGDAAAPLMLCLHGFPECWYSWRHVLRAFSGTHHVVALDMRGYGETSHSAASWWGAGDYSLRVLVQDVREVVAAMGRGRVLLVAHDWGGQVAWAFAAAYPHMVDKLVIMNSPHPLLFRKNMTLRQAIKSSYMAMFQVPYVPELLLSAGNFNFLHTVLLGRRMGVRRTGPFVAAEADVAVNRWVFSRAGTLTAALNYYRAMMTSSAAYLRTVNMKGITVPTLVLWGEEDGALDFTLCNGLEEVCSDVRVVPLANASHWVQQDAVEDVIAAMATFLQCETNALTSSVDGGEHKTAESAESAELGVRNRPVRKR